MTNELILIVEDNAKNRKLMRDALQFTDIRLSRSRPVKDGVPVAGERPPRWSSWTSNSRA